MSLMVYPYKRNPTDGSMIFIENAVKEPHNELFGFEIYRKTLWGSITYKKLGCKLLTSLRKTNVFAEGSDLDVLEKELLIIRDNLDKQSNNISGIRFNIANGLEAIRVARQYENGGVCIS